MQNKMLHTESLGQETKVGVNYLFVSPTSKNMLMHSPNVGPKNNCI